MGYIIWGRYSVDIVSQFLLLYYDWAGCGNHNIMEVEMAKLEVLVFDAMHYWYAPNPMASGNVQIFAV